MLISRPPPRTCGWLQKQQIFNCLLQIFGFVIITGGVSRGPSNVFQEVLRFRGRYKGFLRIPVRCFKEFHQQVSGRPRNTFVGIIARRLREFPQQALGEDRKSFRGTSNKIWGRGRVAKLRRGSPGLVISDFKRICDRFTGLCGSLPSNSRYGSPLLAGGIRIPKKLQWS